MGVWDGGREMVLSECHSTIRKKQQAGAIVQGDDHWQ